MRRFSALLMLLLLLAALAACGGGGSTTVFGNPATITVTPGSTSINVGVVENSNTIVTDSKGTTLFTSGGTASTNVTFSSSNTGVLQVSNNGLLCAGQWDSLATPVVCTPNSVVGNPPPAVGSATITVKSGSITTTSAAIFVHLPVDRIDITGAPADVASCISQGATAQLTATAFSAGQDVTSTVGSITITPTIADVVTVDANNLATAADPGQSLLVADVGSFRSSSVPFTVCPVQSIKIHKEGLTDLALALNSGETQVLSADVTDTKGATVIVSKASATSAGGGLTWSATSPSATVTPLTPVVTDITSTTLNNANVAFSRAGSQSIVASCTPPRCNAGLAQDPAHPTTAIYSNIVTASSSGTTTSTVFVTGTDTTQLIPIPTSSNTPGTAITLSNQPNSLLIGQDGAHAMLGSAGGLMVVDANGLTFTGTFTSVTGKVLAVAPDGKTTVVSDTSKGQVFVGDATSGTFQTFNIPGVTAAAYSPDYFRLYLASPTAISVISPGSAIRTLAFGATDVTSYATGSFAFFASGVVHVRAACNLASLSDVGTSGTTLVKALPTGNQVLAAGPNTLDAIDVTTDNAGCPPSLTNTNHALGISGTPSQIITTSDGTRAFITNDTANLVTYEAATHTPATINLPGTTASFTGGVTLDGTQLYVGVAGSTPVVHRIDLTTNTDEQQITVSSTAFTPNLVAVRP